MSHFIPAPVCGTGIEKVHIDSGLKIFSLVGKTGRCISCIFLYNVSSTTINICTRCRSNIEEGG